MSSWNEILSPRAARPTGRSRHRMRAPPGAVSPHQCLESRSDQGSSGWCCAESGFMGPRPAVSPPLSHNLQSRDRSQNPPSRPSGLCLQAPLLSTPCLLSPGLCPGVGCRVYSAPCFHQASAQVWVHPGGLPSTVFKVDSHFLLSSCHLLTCFLFGCLLVLPPPSSLPQLECSTKAGVLPWSVLSPQSPEQCLGQRHAGTE